nr:EamA family transporter [Amycolatopsis sp.]
MSSARLAVASLVLVPVAPVLKARLPRRRDLPLIALCGLTGMSAYQLLLNRGEVHVLAGTASVLLATAFLGEPWLSHSSGSGRLRASSNSSAA